MFKKSVKSKCLWTA